MNNRIFLVLIFVLSGVLLLIGTGLIGAALYLGAQVPIRAAAFPTTDAVNALLTPAAEASGIKPGTPAPDFAVKTLEGATLRLSQFRGKPVMINFWASWCGPCTAEMKNIEAVYQKHRDEFVILAVNQGESRETVSGYKELWKLNFRLLLDESGEATRAYHILALPTTIFVDHEGKIYQVHLGGPMSVEFIETRVQELLDRMR